MMAFSKTTMCNKVVSSKAKSFEFVLLNYDTLLETLQYIVSESDGTFKVVAKAEVFIAYVYTTVTHSHQLNATTKHQCRTNY